MPTKPERIQYSKLALTIDGVQAHRVQRFGSSGDISREKIQQLSDSGVVEWRSNIPVVSITMDTNDVGSTDTLALASDRMIVKSLATETDGPRGGHYRFYIKSASANAVVRTVTQDNFLTAYCDFMVPITEDDVNVGRAMWIHRGALTGISWSYDVNGFAAENYTFTADNKRWFLNDWKYARVYKPHNVAQASTDPTNSAAEQIWINMDSAIPDASQILYYCKNDQVYGNARMSNIGANGTIFASTAVGAYGGRTGDENTGGFAIGTSGASLDSAAATDNVHFVYITSATAPGGNWDRTSVYGTAPGYEIDSVSTSFGAISRAYVAAYLYNTDGPFGETTLPSAATLRLQTVNIDASFTEEQLLQLSYKKAYGVSRIDPTFAVTVTANDSDLDLFARLCATSESSANEFSIDDFSEANKLVIMTYNSETQNEDTKTRTITLSDMVVTGENHDVTVGGNAVQEFTFTTDNITATGSGVSITGYI